MRETGGSGSAHTGPAAGHRQTRTIHRHRRQLGRPVSTAPPRVCWRFCATRCPVWHRFGACFSFRCSPSLVTASRFKTPACRRFHSFAVTGVGGAGLSAIYRSSHCVGWRGSGNPVLQGTAPRCDAYKEMLWADGRQSPLGGGGGGGWSDGWSALTGWGGPGSPSAVGIDR